MEKEERRKELRGRKRKRKEGRDYHVITYYDYL